MTYHFFLDDCSMTGVDGYSFEFNVIAEPTHNGEYVYYVSQRVIYENPEYDTEVYREIKRGPLVDQFVQEHIVHNRNFTPEWNTYSEEIHGYLDKSEYK